MKKFLFLIFFSFTSIINLNANHLAGSTIAYQRVSGDTFLISLRIYQDCSNHGRQEYETVNICNTCGSSDTLRLSLQKEAFYYDGDSLYPNQRTGAIERTQICDSLAPQTTCASGGTAGFEVFYYFGSYIMKQKCNSWHLSHSSSCCVRTSRNTMSNGMVARARFNSLTDSTNSSVIFSDRKVMNVCIGQKVEEKVAVFDPDGDSLRFSFVEGFSEYQCTSGMLNLFRAPHTYYEPLTGASINASNGKLSFTPSSFGNFFFVVEVEEFDKGGNLKGTNLMQFLVVVSSCSNQAPFELFRGPHFGNGAFFDTNQAEVCIGEKLQFKLRFKDSNKSDNISFETNAETALPGVLVSQMLYGDSAEIEFVWNVKSVEKGYRHLQIAISDNACPVPGITVLNVTIHVADGADAGPDINICRGSQVAELKAFGGTSYLWTALPGGSGINIGQNFSCDTCKTVLASPRHTTDYVVQNNAWSSCGNRDTVRVVVNKNFNLTTSPDDTVCMIDTVSLTATASDSSLKYRFHWSPASQLLTDTGARVRAFGLVESKVFKVIVGSDSNCVKEAHVSLTVPGLFPYKSEIVSSNDYICKSDTIDLRLKWGEDLRPSCQSSNYDCLGNDTIFSQSVQTQTYNSLGSLNEPAPYAGFVSSSRQQFLYHASELRAMGMQKGDISSIGFYNDSLGIASPFFHNYTISMACTQMNNVNLNFVDEGLIQVFDPKTIRVDSGITLHEFDRSFLWDGVSNLIVTICFDNLAANPNRTANVRTLMLGTNYAAFISSNSFREGACYNKNSSNASSRALLPKTRFGQCLGYNPSNFRYNWYVDTSGSGNFITTTNSSETKVFVNSNSAAFYHLVLEDTNGICSDTLQYKVNLLNKYNVKPIADTNICISVGVVDLKSPTPWNVLARPNGGFWSGTGVTSNGPGRFDPSVAGVGSHWIIYEIRGDSCANKDSSLFKVKGIPDPSFSEGPFCELDSLNPLDTNQVHQRSYFVVDYGNGLLDTSNFIKNRLVQRFPSVLAVNHYAFDACWSDTTIGVQIDAAFNANISGPVLVCINEDSIVYSNADSGGIWTLNGNVFEALFMPRHVGPGNHVIRIDSSGYCGASDSLVVIVPVPLQPNINEPGAFYSGSSAWNLTQLITANPLGGEWSSPGSPAWMPLKELASFVPSAVVNASGYGAYPLYYTINDTLKQPAFKVCSYSDTIDVLFCEGVQGTAIVTTDGNRNLSASPKGTSYMWYRNDSLLNFTGQTIYASQSGKYKVVIFDGLCPSDSSNSLFVPALGVNELESDLEVLVYPNPTRSLIHIEANKQITGLRITNILGEDLGFKKWQAESHIISVDDLPAGLYFLELEFESRKKVLRFEKL